jgi:type I pantothenate kinase
VHFSREEWARLPADALFSLSDYEVRSIEPHLSSEEARQIYLPVSQLLYLHFSAVQGLYRAARAFLVEEREVPYVVGVAGSVAAGKSTVAEVLLALISRWPRSPEVELVSTDGFLYPNRVLQARGLMHR